MARMEVLVRQPMTQKASVRCVVLMNPICEEIHVPAHRLELGH
jgi:hypothetical protein